MTSFERSGHPIIDNRRRGFAEGKSAGARWMIECCDVWDLTSGDEDFGVLFSLAHDEEEVDGLVAKYADDQYNDVIGIFDLALPLADQKSIRPEDCIAGQRKVEQREPKS